MGGGGGGLLVLKFDLKLGPKLGFSPLISISYYGKIWRKIRSQIRENLGPKLGFSPLISISYYGKIWRKIRSQIRENSPPPPPPPPLNFDLILGLNWRENLISS